jgi:hypothetical protein
VGDGFNDLAAMAGQIPARRPILQWNDVARAQSRAHFLWGLSVIQRNSAAGTATFPPGSFVLIRNGINLPLIYPESDITVVRKSRGFRPFASQEETAEVSRN